MQKYLSLNQNTDFQRTYYRGKSSAKPALVVYCLKNRVGICRVGITTSKKTGNAVERVCLFTCLSVKPTKDQSSD